MGKRTHTSTIAKEFKSALHMRISAACGGVCKIYWLCNLAVMGAGVADRLTGIQGKGRREHHSEGPKAHLILSSTNSGTGV